MQFPDGMAEFDRQWSSQAGKLSAIKLCIVEVEKRSAEAFVRRQDQIAIALRDAATALTVLKDEAEKALDAFIEENARRAYQRCEAHQRLGEKMKAVAEYRSRVAHIRADLRSAEKDLAEAEQLLKRHQTGNAVMVVRES